MNKIDNFLELFDLFLSDLSIFFESKLYSLSSETEAFRLFKNLFTQATINKKFTIIKEFCMSICEFLLLYKDEILNNKISDIPKETRIDFKKGQSGISIHLGFVLENVDDNTKKLIRGHLLGILYIWQDDEDSKKAILEYKEKQKPKSLEEGVASDFLEETRNFIGTNFQNAVDENGNVNFPEILQNFGQILQPEKISGLFGLINKFVKPEILQQLNEGELLKEFSKQTK